MIFPVGLTYYHWKDVDTLTYRYTDPDPDLTRRSTSRSTGTSPVLSVNAPGLDATEVRASICMVAWTLDDLTLGGPTDVVAADIDHIIAREKQTGLHINAAKCEIISHSPAPRTGFTVQQLHLSGAP